MNTPVIHVDMSLSCPSCHRPGAVVIDGQAHKCFDCASRDLRASKKRAVDHLPPFWRCPSDIRVLAARLIEEHHPEAVNAKICYLFRKKHTKTNGKINLGTCQRVGEKDKTLHGFDYVILLAWDMWVFLEPIQREACLLHEILHVLKLGEEAADWKIQPHDVEEFAKVIDVYGIWKPDLEAFAASIYRQRGGSEESGYSQVAFTLPRQDIPLCDAITH